MGRTFCGNFRMPLGVFVGTWPNPPLQIRVQGREARTTVPSAPPPITHTKSHRSKHRGSKGSRPAPLQDPAPIYLAFFCLRRLLLHSAPDEVRRDREVAGPQSPHHLQDTFNSPHDLGHGAKRRPPAHPRERLCFTLRPGIKELSGEGSR